MDTEDTPPRVTRGHAALRDAADPILDLAQATLLACERSEDEWEVAELVDRWVDEGGIRIPRRPERSAA